MGGFIRFARLLARRKRSPPCTVKAGDHGHFYLGTGKVWDIVRSIRGQARSPMALKAGICKTQVPFVHRMY